MKLRRRCVDLERDEAVLLEFHCTANYHSDTPWARKTSYESYREEWLSTPQPASFIADLKKSVEDDRTIAEIWETEDGVAAAYVWATFNEVEGYGIVVGEVQDMAVAEKLQRRGIGTEILRDVESVARRNGAAVLRSGAGIENVASRALHEGFGFAAHRVEYEKVLDRSIVDQTAEARG